MVYIQIRLYLNMVMFKCGYNQIQLNSKRGYVHSYLTDHFVNDRNHRQRARHNSCEVTLDTFLQKEEKKNRKENGQL